MNAAEVPTAGQMATMCARCGVAPRMPRAGSRGRYPLYCASCRAEVSAEYNRLNARMQRVDPERREKAYALTAAWVRAHPGSRGRSHRRTRYGLEREHLATWLLFQDGACGLCGGSLDADFNVDHDHDTGVVRGLLHNVCNANLDKHPNAERYKAGWLA